MVKARELQAFSVLCTLSIILDNTFCESQLMFSLTKACHSISLFTSLNITNTIYRKLAQ